MRAFSSCSKWGLFLVGVSRLLIVVASLAAEHRLWGAQALGCTDLGSYGACTTAQGSSCPKAHGILFDRGSHPCLLHWLVGS